MEEDGGGRGTRSRRESSDVSGGQHVHISKDKMRFAKAAEHNFSTEIFRVAKVIDKRPRDVYELEDLKGTPIDGPFYSKERIIDRTAYKIDKIMDK